MFGRISAALALGIFIGISTTGCQSETKCTVKGKIAYKGQPVTAGSVNFFLADKGIGALGEIDATGNYILQGTIAPGTYKVYVSPPTPEQVAPGKAPAKTAKFDLPPKYQDAAQTTISKEVKAGDNTIDIVID